MKNKRGEEARFLFFLDVGIIKRPVIREGFVELFRGFLLLLHDFLGGFWVRGSGSFGWRLLKFRGTRSTRR